MLSYVEVVKGDLIVSLFDDFKGRVTKKSYAYATIYVTEGEHTRRITPEDFGGYYNATKNPDMEA